MFLYEHKHLWKFLNLHWRTFNETGLVSERKKKQLKIFISSIFLGKKS